MKRDLYDKYNFNEDIEIMNLDYMMRNTQAKNQNEDYVYNMESQKQKNDMKWKA